MLVSWPKKKLPLHYNARLMTCEERLPACSPNPRKPNGQQKH